MGVKSMHRSIQLLLVLLFCWVESFDFFFDGENEQDRVGRKLLQNCGVNPNDDCSLDVELYSRIMGGKKVDDRLRWQYAVSLQIQLSDECFWHFCGGTLISEDLIITAAHCIWNRGKDWRADVQSAGDSISGNFTINILAAQNPRCRHQSGSLDGRVRVVRYFIPRKYDGDSVDNDIMILQLQKPQSIIEELGTIQINSNASIFKDLKKSLTIVGWGHTTAEEAASPLGLAGITRQRTANLEYIEQDTCTDMLKGFAMDSFFNKETMICAFNKSADACGGDSGGPLILEGNYDPVAQNYKDDILVGLVSWGPVEGCTSNTQQVTGVYTNIAYFEPWINEVKKASESLKAINNKKDLISANNNKFGQALGGIGSIEKIVYNSLEDSNDKAPEVLPQVMSGDPDLSILLPCPETRCPDQLNACCNYEGIFEIEDNCFETTPFNPAMYNYTGQCVYKMEQKRVAATNFIRTFVLASQRTPTSVEECMCLQNDTEQQALSALG